MIYLDNAATTLQKPPAVLSAMVQAAQCAGGYGRSGHRAALYAGEVVFACRVLAAELFGLDAPERIIFTLNATHAINQAIHALADENTIAAVSGYEHNAVIRPLVERGIAYRVLEHAPFDPAGFLERAAQALAEGANLFIINHMSNVFGGIVPLQALDDMLAQAHIPLIIDASQSAGAIPLDAGALRSAAAVCMPGHKGLLGPQGTGMLLLCSDAVQKPLMYGGTGSLSSDLHQPLLLPDRFESGTPNVVGIAGLAEGIRYVLQRGVTQIAAHERRLTGLLAARLEQLPHFDVFRSTDDSIQGGVLSFRHAHLPCETLAEVLAAHDICVRAGLHCAPLAHDTAGTADTGTVRASFSALSTEAEVASFLAVLIAEKI